MATKLTKPVVRHVEAVYLRARGFASGLVCRITDEGVYVKPPKGRWSRAYFASWADIVLAGGIRAARERKDAAKARRAARKGGVA